MDIPSFLACSLLAACLGLAAPSAVAAGAGQAGDPLGAQYSLLYHVGEGGLQVIGGIDGGQQVYGVADEKKRIVIPPRYRVLQPIYLQQGDKFTGMLAFELPGNPHCGLIGAQGKVLAQAEFDRCPNYFDGNGLGQVGKGQRVGLVDLAGRIVLAPAYRAISSFDPALHVARVTGKDSKIGIIDTKGKVLLPPIYNDIGDFNAQGFAELEKNGKEGMVDRSWRVRIPPKYDQLRVDTTDALPGMHLALLHGKYGYVDDNGKVRVPIVFDDLQGFYGGKAVAIGKRSGKYGAIGQDGQLVLPFVYEGLDWLVPEGEKPPASASPELRAKYQGRWGTLGLDGQWHIAPTFEGLGAMGKNGWIVAWQGGKLGYVDRQGQWKIPPRFDNALPFDSGNQRSFAALQSEPGNRHQHTLRWGLIDEKGNWVRQPAFAYPPETGKFTPFGVAAVEMAPGSKPAGCFAPCCCQGLIDGNGKWVVPPVFSSIRVYDWQAHQYKPPYVDADYWTPGRNAIYGNKLYPNGKIEYGTYQRNICGVQVGFNQKDLIASFADQLRAKRACASQGLDEVLQGVLP